MQHLLSEEEIFYKVANHEISKEQAMTMLQTIKNGGINPEKSPAVNDYDLEKKVEGKIIEIVTESLHISEDELHSDLSFKDLGVDSINGMEIIRDINRSFGLSLDSVVLYDHATASKLTEFVLGEIKKTNEIYSHVTQSTIENTVTETVQRPQGKKVLEQRQVEQKSLDRKLYETRANEARYDSRAAGNLSENESDLKAKVAVKITEIVTESLHLSEDELRSDLSFKDLGVDSINGMEIIRDINRSFGLSLDSVVLYDYATLAKLTEFVFDEINKNNEIYDNVTQKASKKTADETIQKPKMVLQQNNDYINRGNENAVDSNKNSGKIQLSYGNNVVAKPVKTEKIALAPTGLSVDSRIAQKEDNRAQQHQDIAIIGISGRFPGAQNVNEFWGNMKNGVDSVIEVPKERWNAEQYFDANPKTPNKSYSKVGGFLEDIDRFDSLFFNLPPVEAISMDPQQRLFLEETWRALEDAGYSDTSLANTKCGVFVGASQGDYLQKLAEADNDTSGEAFTGMATSILASRISYFLDLTGPCITVDTACSSSLVALHLACQSMRNGESDLAIVGGVKLMITPDLHIATSKVEMLSPSGKCKAFDQAADGTIISEGVGVLVLKPVGKALEDKHQIYGVIKASGINQDGKTNGITAPSVQSQTRLELEVYEKGKINPQHISLVEAHGTGTKLGDPIEVKALTNAFKNYTQEKEFCAIGSVKANIGHATMAAGVASVIKVLLALKHKKIPPMLHFDQPNEHINFPETPFYVNKNLIDWLPKPGIPRMAAVSSFGFSGTNAHVVIEDSPRQEAKRLGPGLPYYLIPVSAKSQEAFDRKIHDLTEWLEENEGSCFIGDIAHTLLVGRSHFSLRGAFIVRDINELKSRLKEALTGASKDYFMNRQNVKVIKTEPSLKEFIHGIINDLQNSSSLKNEDYKEKLSALAEYYVKGYDLNFKGLFGQNYRLIHLPTYPFAGDSYWIDAAEASVIATGFGPVSKLHPLIDKNVSTLEEQSFETTFTGEEFYLKDHLVGEDKVLPAVAYLEMAKIAGDLASSRQKVVKVVDNSWLDFIKLDQPGMKVNISLIPVKSNQNLVEFEVVSKSKNGRSVVHGKGKIIYDSEVSNNPEAEFIDIAAIKNRCKETISGERCYELFRLGQLNLGRSFQSIQKLYVNDSEVLAVIELPDHLKASFKDYKLHPTLMDGALEAVVGFAADMESGKVRLPFMLGEVEILGDLTERCYSYVKYMGTTNAGLREVEKFDVVILNESGQVVIKMKDFSFWDLGKMQKSAAPSIEAAPTSDKVMGYTLDWEKSQSAPVIQSAGGNGTLLIFDTDSELFNTLNDKSPNELQKVVLVKPAANYQEHPANNVYEINPAEKEDYLRLIASLAARKLFPENIFYMWSKEPFSGIEAISNANLDRSIYPALYLTQALAEQKPAGKIKLNYLFRGTEKSFSPLAAAFSGFVRSVRLENPKFIYKTTRIEPSATVEVLSNMLRFEFATNTEKETEILYKGNERLIRKIRELDLEANAENNQQYLTNNGVYLITGGLGNLGLIFARYLAKEYKAKLCLTGRGSLDEKKEALVKEIENLGSEIIYIKADISQKNDAEAVIGAVKSRFGRINGIIHCAGTNKDSYIIHKTRAEMDQVLGAKIWGTINLDLLTKNDNLDFFAVFSSTAAIIGNLGQADYAYANSFMDYYAQLREQLRNNGERYGKTLSLNWSLWREGGMKVSKETETLFETMGVKPLETGKGIDSFLNGLKSKECQIIVLAGQPEKLGKLLGIEMEQPLNENVASIQGNVNLLSKIQKTLSGMVGDILRIKEKDIHLDKDMNEFGFNSLTFTDFSNRINQTYDTQLTPSVFFEHPTLKSFAVYLHTEYYEAMYAKYREELQVSQPVIKLPTLEKLEAHPGEDIIRKERFQRFPTLEDLPVTGYAVSRAREPIAIIGMSGVMPQSDNLEAFWDNLEACRHLIRTVPPERWNYTELPDNISKWGGFMNEVDKFDPLFFGISPFEAEFMDPQQRIFLQTVWETIEDAGYKPSDLSGTKTGLFVGVATRDYIDVLQDNGTEIEALSTTGNSHCVLANRISYLLNLHGPSEPIDTACSSSLIAIHRGVESIYNGDCDLAIAGGVNVMLSPSIQISFSKAGMLSPDGMCKTFDTNADGYVRGEGSGAILLKPLSKALSDGDHIYALVKGTSINHGGRAASLTAPNPNAQADLIIEALRKADFTPDTMTYIEAHGTGTKLGDPIEINGLVKAFKELNKEKGIASGQKEYCGISSVKTNIGHLEPAAGIAGILKVVLSMKHKKLPGIVNFQGLNPYIQLNGSPFYIVEKTQDWKPLIDESGREITRRAGVSSFGFGGANAHVVLEEYIKKQKEHTTVDSPQIVVLSGKNEQRLKAYAEKLVNYLARVRKDSSEESFDLIDLAYTLQVGREAMEERLACVVKDIPELMEKLEGFLQGKTNIDAFYRGNAKINQERSDFLVEGRAGREFINIIIKDGEFERLAQLWVSGIKVNWSLLYESYRPNRISLPTYPFEKRRVWVPERQNKKTEISVSPTVDKQRNQNAQQSTQQQVSIFDSFYLPAWKPAPVIAGKSESSPNKMNPQKKIVFVSPVDTLGIVEALIAGHREDAIVDIKLGREYKRIDDIKWEIDVNNSEALDNCFQQIQEFDQIYFLGGLVSPEIDHTDLATLDQTQEQGIISLFRLIKSLINKGFDNQRISLKIITNNVNKLTSAERTIPYAGSILGLIKAMAKEIPYWEISCLDLDFADFDLDPTGDKLRATVKLIIEEPVNSKGEEILIRNGERYIRSIEPVEVPEAPQMPFKQNGVYVILGGAGGIGLELSLYLAKTVQARIALLGRSELTEEKKVKISNIEAAGGKIIYLQVDATDLHGMKQAITETKSRFGEINGVVHSAIVMKDKALRNMSEEDLKTALDPKVKGSVVLYQAVQEEKLDFMMFFSSIQTFVGNAGQANYAAACAFKDAFATYISEMGNVPVKIINWGYWGTVGVAATEEHNKRIASAGLISIMPEEGMEVIKRIVYQDRLIQVIVFKAEPYVLKMANIGLGQKTDNSAYGTESVLKNTFDNKTIIKQSGKKLIFSEKSSFDEDDLRHYVEEKTVQCIAEALKIDINEVDRDNQFSEYGVDSITGLKLIKNINEAFDIMLKTTVLFDYGNVKDLTDYLINEYAQNIKESSVGINNTAISHEAVSEIVQAMDYDNIELLERLALGELNEDEVLKRIAN
jgi:polyketide synthase PksN